jgi:hypothetical protein
VSYTRTVWIDNSMPFIDAAGLNNMEEGIVDVDARITVAEGIGATFTTFRTASGGRIASAEVNVTFASGVISTLVPLASGGQHVLGASALMTSALAAAVPGLLYVASGTVAQPTVNAPLYRSDGATFRKVAPGIIPAVKNLPTNPNDGDEIYYLADDTNGMVWHLRYRAASASAFKWECIGGVPLMPNTSGDMTTTTNVFTALTSGPTFPVPLAGDYRIGLAITFVIASASIGQASVYVGGVAKTAVGSNVGQVTNSGYGRSTGLVKGDTVEVRCANANSVSTRYVSALIEFMPIRVG